MSKAAKFDIVLDYLGAEFPGFAVEYSEGPDGYRCELRHVNEHHVIVVLNEFLDACLEPDVETQLRNYGVADVVRGMGDMPVSVTNYGCILDRGVT